MASYRWCVLGRLVKTGLTADIMGQARWSHVSVVDGWSTGALRG